MSDEKKGLKFVTPRGPLVYPKLTKPDTKYKAEGEYRAKQRFTADAFPADKLAELEALRDALAEETRAALTKKKEGAKAKALTVRDVLTTETDKETGEPTGFVLINAKMSASGVSKKDGKPWRRSPKLFDAAGRKLPPNVQIWGGTEAKLAVEARPYYTPKDNEVGIAFYLNAAQVLKLVKGGGEAASDHGFGAEEGYTSDEDSGSFPGEESVDSENPGEGMPSAAAGAGDDF